MENVARDSVDLPIINCLLWGQEEKMVSYCTVGNKLITAGLGERFVANVSLVAQNILF